MTERPLGRRSFLALAAVMLVPGRGIGAHPGRLTRILARATEHPTPRPGITGAHVLTASQLEDKSAAPIFDMVRKIPEVADGIHCYCGCASVKGFYSLLSCYEEKGMAQHCTTCQGEGKLVARLHGEGWSLNGIRAAVDAAYGESA